MSFSKLLIFFATVVATGITLCRPAWCQAIETLSSKPTFNCANATSIIARAICSDPKGSQADWALNSTVWAYINTLPAARRQSFSREQDDWQEGISKLCSQPDQSSAMLTCVLKQFQVRTIALRAKLSGDALAEAATTPEQHEQIQKTLISIGFLTGIADGEFGADTRKAIGLFQQRNGFRSSGFLNPEQFKILSELAGKQVPNVADSGRTTSVGEPQPSHPPISPMNAPSLTEQKRTRVFALIDQIQTLLGQINDLPTTASQAQLTQLIASTNVATYAAELETKNQSADGISSNETVRLNALRDQVNLALQRKAAAIRTAVLQKWKDDINAQAHAPIPDRANGWEFERAIDKLDDSTRLRATTQIDGNDARYQITLTCQKQTPNLRVVSLEPSSTEGKAIIWSYGFAGSLMRDINARIDSEPALNVTMLRASYINVGVVSGLASEKLFSSKRIVLANIFPDEQLEIETDFPDAVRNICTSLLSDPPPPPPPPPPPEMPLYYAINELQARIRQCWDVPIGVPGTAPIRARITLTKTGELANDPEFQTNIRDQFTALFTESITRALRKCAPYKMPASSYESWRSLEMKFDPTH